MLATPPALAPQAVAFRDARHGLLGTGQDAGGTISITADGGRSFRVVLRTQRPVVGLTYAGPQTVWAEQVGGRLLRSGDGGRTWRRAGASQRLARASFLIALVTPRLGWLACLGQGGAGNQEKAVYRTSDGGRSWRAVAETVFYPRRRVHGGILGYGYPLGLAFASDGFGLLWEGRGTLYVTRDGGAHWRGLDRLVRPEIDFCRSAAALPGGRGFVLVGLGGGPARLLATSDGGRTWRVAHRWR